MKSSSSRVSQDDGALVEAVSMAKSNKERGQSKFVLDVADFFAGNALDFICSSPSPRSISDILMLTLSKVLHLNPFLSQLDPLMLPAPVVHTARGGIEGATLDCKFPTESSNRVGRGICCAAG